MRHYVRPSAPDRNGAAGIDSPTEASFEHFPREGGCSSGQLPIRQGVRS